MGRYISVRGAVEFAEGFRLCAQSRPFSGDSDPKEAAVHKGRGKQQYLASKYICTPASSRTDYIAAMDDDHTIFVNRNPGKTVVSKRFDIGGKPARIASQVMDGVDSVTFQKVGDEVVLRTTRGGRQMIKAVFLEDNRALKTLTIQKYVGDGFAPTEQHFTFVSAEIDTLIDFLASIPMIPLEDGGKRHLSATELRNLFLTKASAQQLFGEHEELFVEAAQNATLKRDLIALGYRRAQLARFERLLQDVVYFAAERSALGPNKRPEDVWQAFFETNPWIFGHGLSYVFATSLDQRKLEQVIQGASFAEPGKRVDALMKSRARINSLCFVEIKRHDTPLLASGKDYRSGVFAPSSELGGGIAQVQATVQVAIDRLGHRVELDDRQGNPTGEMLFNFDPRAFLVIGSLGEFVTAQGPNEAKFRSFELFRRNIRRPEIITFDELLNRARFIVETEMAR